MSFKNLPKPFVYLPSTEKAETWYSAQRFTWSPVFEAWIQQLDRYTVRPGETPCEAYKRETGKDLTQGNILAFADF